MLERSKLQRSPTTLGLGRGPGPLLFLVMMIAEREERVPRLEPQTAGRGLNNRTEAHRKTEWSIA